LAHEHVGVGGLGDSRKLSNVGENDGNFLSDSAKLSRYGIVHHPSDDLLRDEASERPYGALREIHRTAKFVNFLNA
jgi:hypothetical protein